jgi:large subunit ribosomal protein L25
VVNIDKPVELKVREKLGKGLATLRAEGLAPAVIHDHGNQSLHVMALESDLAKIYKEAGKHHPLNLEVGDKKFLALIKDVEMHPIKRRVDHIVFQAIRRDEKVEAEVPIHLEGEIPAEKVGLMILHQLDTVEIQALPQDLIDEIRVDATKLVEIGDQITVADLVVPAGVTILTEADHPIARVAETKAMMSEEELAADAEASAAQAAESAEGAEGAEGAEPTPASEEAKE